MSLLRSNLTGCTCQLNSPLTAPLLNLHPVLHPTRASSQFRVWRRRRRLRSIVVLRCHSVQSSPLETLMQSLVSQFPSVNSLDLVAPALGFASGLALFFLNPNRFNSGTKVSDSEGGGGEDCMLLTSPTAFNRFVVLRCPCISFQGNELLNLNEKLLQEDTHFVRIRVSSSEEAGDGDDDDEEKLASLEYQRVCVDTDDGGVISLDWPAHLDLRDELGLDTTLLLIPGTAQGSMGINIRSMVRESLQQGCFPIVINPRGCAGSPLTTPRLFTAADSDDICTAINFINRERPWATLMAVGWGYGANILTKYLGEVGDRTPLNAATCIDNPFDLQEATRSSHHYIDLDRKLTGGLIDILQSNKELFQGRAKGFNVEKALLSKSIRDFDEAISMISNGYDALEDFYAACSTRDVVMNVKIPVLFIQNNDGTLPLLSIPRGLIAENPFTSLLVYCFSPSQIAKTRSSSVRWSHHLSIEWLMAVELGLLKGRHPLLKDVDVTVSPSKGGAVTEVRESVERGKMNKLPNVSSASKANGYVVHPPKDVKGNVTSINDGLKIREDSRINSAVENIAEEPIGTVNIESAEQGLTNEGGQVLQTADVAMKVLDVTMPGTLTEERKKKALAAVAQGETVLKALQDAVPEDVREKLTTAVSKVLNDEGTAKKLDQLVNVSRISDVASGLTSKIQKNEGELSSSGVNKNPEQRPMTDKVLNDNQVTEGKPTGEPGTDLPAPGTLQKPASDGQLESTTRGIENSSPVGNDSAELEKIQKKADVSTEGGDTEGVSDTGAKPNLPKRSERTSDPEDITADNLKADRDGELAKPATEVADNIHQNVESATNSSSDQKEEGTNKDEAVSDPSSSSEPQLMEREGSINLNEENHTPSSVNQSNSDAPNLDVSQALDALTGMDDSTQVAVNSVFGVIEDMITKLEVEKEANGAADDAKGSEDMGIESDNHRPNNGSDKSPENTNSEPDITNHHCTDEGRESVVTRKTFLEQNNVENSINTPLYITSSHYNDPLYNRYLQTYLLPKMPNSKALDLDGTTSLFLDYIPEEGRWKLLEPAGRNKVCAGDIAADKSINRAVGDHFPPESDKDKLIEPSYVIMDAEKRKEMQGYDMIEEANATVVNNGAEELRSFIKHMIIDTLKFEVQRKLGDGKTQDMELLSVDMEQVADTVVGGLDILRLQVPESKRYNSNKLGTLNGEQIIRAISFALPQTNKLRRVLPVGVAVGASLAALRRFFDVAAVNGIIQSDVVALNQINGSLGRNNVQLVKEEADEVKIDQNYSVSQSRSEGEAESEQVRNDTVMADEEEADEVKIDQNYSVSQSRSEGEAESEQVRNDTVMAGCVTAALGASALLVNQQDSADSNDIFGTSHTSSEQNSAHQKDLDERDEESGKKQNNMVASLAEKAMSVAAPVVPVKEDGGVDQERLVAMLAEWGQKGGMLRLVGKVALLWGGMRGAMSLTYKLISFLRIAERPLLQRILGFVCMVLVLWSPVVVPLLPTIIQGWTTHNTSKFTELICVIGLYGSTMILVMLWGKRIRGYENPFQQYGLDITSLPKIQNLLKGLVGGVILVVSIHSLNVLLGCVQLSWPSTFVPFSPDAMSWLKVYCRIFLLVSQGIITATGIAVVEELLFRSWLPDEIAEEFGHHRAVIISGLAFSVFQRYPLAVPGLWLLSLSLSGAKQRSQGSLSVPIGLRAGIMASNYVLQTGGFLTCQPNFPLWVTGTHPFQPFSGVAGFTLSLLLAIALYPRQLPSPTKGRNMLN